jgi:YYY domain-containing protein
LLGGWLNTLSLFEWDGGTGQHPDERFMTDVASRLRVPSSLSEYLDSQRNPLNPRNVDKTFYVYGLLPQTLTHVTAVVLTPNSALPPVVAAPSPRNYGATRSIANPDLRVPKIQPLQLLLNPTGKDLTGYYEVYKVGRAWSASFALLSVIVVFLLGRRLYGARVGLLAALLLALAVLPIQIAHFFTVDSATAFFTLLSIYWAVRLAQNGGLGSAIALGLSIGAAMACRVTMATLGMLAVVAIAQRLLINQPAGAEAEEPLSSDDSVYFTPKTHNLAPLAGVALIALAGVLSILSFRLLQPDAFVGTSFFDLRPEPRFIQNIRDIGAIVSGVVDTPPSQQWAGRIPFVFALQNMIIWGMGPLLGLAAWIGWAVAGARMVRAAWAGWNGAGWNLLRRQFAHVLPWVWVAFYFAWQGGQLVMTMRYYLQLYGLLALFAAWGLIRIVDFRFQIADWARKKSAILRLGSGQVYNLQSAICWLPLVLVVAGTLCWAYAFTRIYTRPHSRIVASRWIYEHIPAGSVLTSEQWDDTLPLAIDGRRALAPQVGGTYYNIQMMPYAEDDQVKYTGYIGANGTQVPGLLDQLDAADYIILSSNRVYGSATRLPMRYPALTRYYHYLFDGELGFEQVADITSYPTLFGIPIPDQGAEEAFSVYDHPRVLIFKKTDSYSRATAEQLIAGDIAWDEVYKLPTPLGGRLPTALRLTQDEWPSYRDAGTWAARFNPAGLVSQLPWLFWLLALELLGLGLFLLLFRLLPSLPDRGFALAKTLGVLLVAYAAWLLGSLKLLAFGPSSVWLCAGLLLAIGAAASWRRRAEIWQFIRQRRNALIAAEGLFLLAYLGFVLIRTLNPDLWHPARSGEKSMDLAFLIAVAKSPYFPPYDPWFAGGYINYSYFGYVIVNALVHMTGIAPTTAYNLAVPTLFALTALGAWGVGYNLIAPRQETGDRRHETGDRGVNLSLVSRLLSVQERRAIVTGLIAAVFVVLLSPLTQALWYLPGSAAPPSENLPPECQVSSYAAQQLCRGRVEWAFWDAPWQVGMDLQDTTINEFPFYTFLFGDLHTHMLALPLALAALGLMVALIRTENREQRTKSNLGGMWSSSLFFVLCSLALVVGALRATNAWDYPTYLGLSLATLGLIAWRRWQHGAPLPPTALAWLVSALTITLGSTLLFAPFLRSFATDYTGFTLWMGRRTPAADFLKINGLWLFLLWSGALLFYRRRDLGPIRLGLIGGGALVLAALSVALHLTTLVLLLPLAGMAIGVVVDLLLESGRPANAERQAHTSAARPLNDPYVQLRLPFEDLAALPEPGDTWRFTRLTTLLPIIWVLVAILVALAAEVVVANGDIGRMNTVAKLGLQSWVLFALASAVAFSSPWPVADDTASAGARTVIQKGRAYVWRGAAILLIAAALVYPLTATPARLADRVDARIGPTLDGIAFMRSDRATWVENNRRFDFRQEAAALDWMRANVEGTPIVLEAHSPHYRWGGRVAIYTGLPTLLGWSSHETQQRSVAGVQPVLASRQGMIQDLYNSTDADAALRLLKLYGIEYVYVGQLERALYSPAGLAKFDTLAQAQRMRQVYAEGDTRIYQVPRGSNLPAVLSTTLAATPPTLASSQGTRLNAPTYTLPAVGEYAWNGLAASQLVSVLLWLLACYALLALGLPPALLVFGRGRSGDGGYAWARLIGLLILGYAVWLPVSLGLWSYNRWGLVWGTLLVLALDIAILIRLGRGRMENDSGQGSSQSSILNSQFRSGLAFLRDHFRAHRRSILIVEVLFLAAFAFMAVLRAFNPDLWQPFWGGEKPFEFAFLNAILRSPVMPPFDPFFSDGKINYYYYGLFLVSLPIKATGINPAVAFNLIIPTLFATTLAGAFALVARLTGRVRYGLVGGAFVALLGNLASAFPVGWGQGLAPAQEALRGGLSGFGERLGSWFVGPSRVIEIPDRLLTINEFPFWSYLFADLHPHLIAMPITLLVIALAFELFDEGRRTKDESFQSSERGSSQDTQRPSFVARPEPFAALKGNLRRRVRLSSIGLAALALGALAVTNSWDFPTYALLLAGTLAGRAWRMPGRSGWRRAGVLASALLQAAGIGLAALLLYLPFFQNYVRPAGINGIGVVRDGSPVGQFVLVYGLYLLILGLWIFGVATRIMRRDRTSALLADRSVDPTREGSTSLGIVARPPSTAGWWPVLRNLIWITLALLALTVVTRPQVAANVWASPLLLKLGLLALLVAGTPVLLVRRLPTRVWFIVWLAVLAWAVSLGIELIYIRDHLDGSEAYRMNTVFKFGLQAWILMAVAAGAALPWLMRGLRRAGVLAQMLGSGLIGALASLAVVFLLVGIPSRLAFRFPETPGVTLDGLAFMDRAVYNWNNTDIALQDDGDAIRWLNANIHGAPIVLQSSLEFYRAYGVRIAANTGLPTVVSPLHASEQHDPQQVAERDRDVQQIYYTLDTTQALRLLAKYHVGYIYVGAIERTAYGEAGMAKFDRLVGQYLTLAYRNAGVKIYKVNPVVYSMNAGADVPPPKLPQPVEEPEEVAEQPLDEPQADESTLEALEQQVAANPTASLPAFGLAKRYRGLNRLDDAAAVLKVAALANPKDVGLHHLWGDILRDAGRADEAEAAYRDAVAASPEAGNYNKLGVELMKWGKLDQAGEAFNQAIAADANAAEPYYHLGEIYEQQGQVDQAIDRYRTYLTLAITADPYYDEATEALYRLKK